MERTSVADARNEQSIGRTITLSGWIRTRRDSKGGFSFLEVNDGSCMANIQVIADAELANYEQEIKHLSAGCSVTLRGEVKPSQGKGQATEIQAAEVTVHGWADPAEYPLQKKRHSFEKLREWAHLRPRTNTFGAVARVRNCICNAIHQYFQELGFLYIHTPVITASDCEGAGEMFRVTTLDPGNAPRTDQGEVDYGADFFDRPSYLTVSGQLEAEIYATAVGKVYTFGPTFRAENSNTPRHLAEFWMVEPEIAFCDLNGDMRYAEGADQADDRRCARPLRRRHGFLQSANRQNDSRNARNRSPGGVRPHAVHRGRRDSGKMRPRLRVPGRVGRELAAEHERYISEEHVKGPVIVYDYPKTIKPFYMYVNDDERTVRAMDVLVPRVGEIIGGSQREDRLDVLEARMQEQDLNAEDYWWYLDLRRFGTVPHAGFGLGLERAVQFATGMQNIRDVIPFPRTPGNAEF
jgi:asparaginyl-tRNA synthetase